MSVDQAAAQIKKKDLCSETLLFIMLLCLCFEHGFYQFIREHPVHLARRVIDVIREEGIGVDAAGFQGEPELRAVADRYSGFFRGFSSAFHVFLEPALALVFRVLSDAVLEHFDRVAVVGVVAPETRRQENRLGSTASAPPSPTSTARSTIRTTPAT